jgi:hypothetical protein
MSSVNHVPAGTFTVQGASGGTPVPVSGTLNADQAFIYNGASATVTYSASASADNRGLPVVVLAGEAAAPIAVGSGSADATTVRTTPATDSQHLLNTRHEAVGTPLSIRISDGTDFLVAGAIAVAQKTVGAITKALHTIAVVVGWDGSTHRELAVDTSGNLKQVQQNNFVPAVFDYVSCDRSASASNVWTYKVNGASGSTVRTVTVVYTDSSKATISSITAV